MAAFAAFLMGWVLHLAKADVPTAIDTTSLTLAGLTLLTLHLLGLGQWTRR